MIRVLPPYIYGYRGEFFAEKLPIRSYIDEKRSCRLHSTLERDKVNNHS